INSSIPMRMYPAVGIALMTTPRYVLLMPLGAVLGAFSVDRLRHDHRVEAARALFRGFLIWER
ncbi:MAG: hypothetical protein KGL74_00800, partial [Elusimicrobia bacterium]|nr:hypothetical protein [Elusimicrobiota bacterium]